MRPKHIRIGRWNALFTLLVFLFTKVASWGQISPPGLDGANSSSWSALGFNQHYAKKWSTVVYIGFETQSNLSSYNLFQNKAISVLNQETSYKMHKYWILAWCTSLRNQSIYDEEAPYELSSPGLRRELRHYLRLFYRRQINKAALACSFRPEYRMFYGPDWHSWPSPTQWRFRFKIQSTWSLNKEKNLGFILANEWLFATDDKIQPNGETTWSPIHFTEDRFSIFLRKQFYKEFITADVGCMHQMRYVDANWGYTFYLSLDLIVNNPFGLVKKIMSDNTSVGF